MFQILKNIYRTKNETRVMALFNIEDTSSGKQVVYNWEPYSANKIINHAKTTVGGSIWVALSSKTCFDHDKKISELIDLYKNTTPKPDCCYDGDSEHSTEIIELQKLIKYHSEFGHNLYDYPHFFKHFSEASDLVVESLGTNHRSFAFNGSFVLPCGGRSIGDQGEVAYRLDFIQSVEGKSFLDVGTEEGYAVLEAIKKGAKSATGVNIHENIEYDFFPDYFRPTQMTLRPRKEIEKTQQFLLSMLEKNQSERITFKYKNIYNILELNETFDVVFFVGVLYHLKNPYLAIENLFNITNELLILETQGIPDDGTLVTRISEEGFVQHSPKAISFLLMKAGFKNVHVHTTGNPIHNSSMFVTATK